MLLLLRWGEASVKSCCLSGLRYMDFPFDTEKDLTATERYRAALRDKLIHVIEKYGITHFVTGLSSESEIDLAETVLSLRDGVGYPVVLECIVLGVSQLKGLSEVGVFRHNSVLIRADERMKLSDRYLVRRRYRRDAAMLHNCGVLLSVTCGVRSGALVGFARKRNIPVETLDVTIFR